MTLHREIAFENDICAHLAAHGWLYEETAAARYDRARALFPDDLIAWVQETQPEAWEACRRPRRRRRQRAGRPPARGARPAGHAGRAAPRPGLVGLKQRVALAQFRPALAMNADIAGPLRRQPAARGAAGALLAAQRELPRPRAVPQRHSRRHGRTENRLHPERPGRDRPVPLRPPAASPRARPAGTAADLPRRRAGAFRRQQQRGAT